MTYPCNRCNMDEGGPICLQDDRCAARPRPSLGEAAARDQMQRTNLALLAEENEMLRANIDSSPSADEWRAKDAEIARLQVECAKSERRAIVFGDIVHSQVVAMQAAVLEGHMKTPAHGLQWIVNTLAGPGHLPDLEEARALGGAQAYWDRETAKHEAFRAAHPGPVALGPNNVEAKRAPRAAGDDTHN